MIYLVRKPSIKVGTEWVQKGSTCQNAANSVAGIARAIYERTFRWVFLLTHVSENSRENLNNVMKKLIPLE